MRILNHAMPALMILALAAPRLAVADNHEFTVAVVPDTQTYTSLRPQIMEAQFDWITANRATENIVYVAHLGDLKDVGACVNATLAWPSLAAPSTEWDIVRGAFDDLDTAGIPYGVTPGNHDFDQRNGTFPADSGGCPNYDPQRPLVGYNAEFPPATLSNLFGANYGNRNAGSNEDNYVRVSSNGVNLLFINLGYQEEAPAAGATASIDWAETIIASFPDHLAFVTSHFIADCNDSTTGGGGGANGSCAATPDYNISTFASNIFDRLRAYENFFMMIGGHRFGESYVALDRAAEGFNPVHVVLANYQHLQYSATNFDTVTIPGPAGGSSGFFKLMRFDLDTMTVDLDSLSPALPANAGIAGNGSTILSVQSNGDRPSTVFSTRDIDPTNPANLVDGGGNPTLHTQSVSNLVDISFAGYATASTPTEVLISVSGAGGVVPENNLAGATFTINVPEGGTISNVTLDLFDFVRSGSQFLPPSGGIVELRMRLTHVDTGTSARIIQTPLNAASFICIAGLNGDYTFDSAAANTLNAACGSGNVFNQPRVIAPGTYRPVDNLSTRFDGEDAAGTWTLTIVDFELNTLAGQFLTNSNWRWGLNITATR